MSKYLLRYTKCAFCGRLIHEKYDKPVLAEIRGQKQTFCSERCKNDFIARVVPGSKKSDLE